jgi:hypothetical protein
MDSQGQLILKDSGDQLALPAFMAQDLGMGTEQVGQYIKPARLKVVQAQKSDDYEAFEEGSVVLVPQRVLLVQRDDPFWFVPLFFYMEWCTVNPLELKAQLKNMIRARSLDPASAIARKANDPERRNSERCPEDPTGKLCLRHKEYFNFVCRVIGHPELGGMPAILSFSGGEWKTGSNFMSLLGMRGRAPIFSNVFQAMVPSKKRQNDKGKWYGIDVENPRGEEAPPPFVQDASEYQQLRDANLKIKQAHENQLLVVDQEEYESGGELESSEKSEF